MFSLIVRRDGLPEHVWWLWCVLSNRVNDGLLTDDVYTEIMGLLKESANG